MHQNPLKILCAYYDHEPDYLGIPPEEALRGHHVTVVHSYSEAKSCITEESRGIPAFDIFLTDVILPGGFRDESDETFPFCPILLQPYLDQALVRGFGILVPKHFETTYHSSCGYSVVVATKKCWTLTDKRDWSRLLDLVIEVSGEADRFIVRTPEEGTS